MNVVSSFVHSGFLLQALGTLLLHKMNESRAFIQVYPVVLTKRIKGNTEESMRELNAMRRH